ncbi:LapA family protein [Ancylobacter sp. VKM B-3255]|uniref:LapA family protein n=2 Tax=Ancylobacter radicis TaxID=2836179 RepID=A0ABS5R6V5_9HYPH|nr:LapA family protein [Ancylobacter radicis]
MVVIVLPLSVGLVMLAVANRQKVGLVVDPFGGNWTVDLPLFLVVFGALILGVVIGGLSVWFNQGRYRRAARRNGREARRATQQAEELRASLATRNAAPTAPRGPGLALASGPATPALTDRRTAA